jgi:hypothetical protein
MNEQAAALAIESVKVRIARLMRELHAASQRSAEFLLYGTRDVRSRALSECALNASGASVQVFIDARSAQNTQTHRGQVLGLSAYAERLALGLAGFRRLIDSRAL